MDITIFHRILRGEIPATVVYETADVLVIKDIHPKAHIHVLCIPKEHLGIQSVDDAVGPFAHVPGLLIETARAFAALHGISGYKLQFNVGPNGGQEVPYIHLHFLSASTALDA